MAYLPNGREVDRALRIVNAELRAALKQTNQQAGKLLAKGRYDEAEQLVAAAKEHHSVPGGLRATARQMAST